MGDDLCHPSCQCSKRPCGPGCEFACDLCHGPRWSLSTLACTPFFGRDPVCSCSLSGDPLPAHGALCPPHVGSHIGKHPVCSPVLFCLCGTPGSALSKENLTRFSYSCSLVDPAFGCGELRLHAFCWRPLGSRHRMPLAWGRLAPCCTPVQKSRLGEWVTQGGWPCALFAFHLVGRVAIRSQAGRFSARQQGDSSPTNRAIFPSVFPLLSATLKSKERYRDMKERRDAYDHIPLCSQAENTQPC